MGWFLPVPRGRSSTSGGVDPRRGEPARNPGLGNPGRGADSIEDDEIGPQPGSDSTALAFLASGERRPRRVGHEPLIEGHGLIGFERERGRRRSSRTAFGAPQWSEWRAGVIAGSGERDTRVAQACEREPVMVVEAHALALDADVFDEAGLYDTDRVESGERVPCSRTADPGVFESEAMVVVTERAANCREGVDGVVDADVADRVDRDPIARASRGERARLEVLHHIAVADAVTTHRDVERDGDTSVGEELDRADAESMVALAGTRTVEPIADVIVQEGRGMGHREH